MEKSFKAIIGLLILLRIAFLNFASKYKTIYLTKDSDHYIELSQDIPFYFFNDSLVDYWLSTFRLPGYPLIINIFTKFFDINLGIYLNLIADLISVFLLYKLLLIYFEKKYAFLGSILFLINMNLLISSTQIMTESFTTLFLFASFYFFRLERFLISGVFISLLSITKPVGIYIIAAYILLIIWKKKNTMKNIIVLVFLPTLLISGLYINNYIQYESGFYSTSSYFHLQWYNKASESLCEDFNFNKLEVSEPGYVFENWLQENNLDKKSESQILINMLIENSRDGLINNLHCKTISSIRSILWNMFGIRSSNWENTNLNEFIIQIVKISSFIYAIIMNLSFLRLLISRSNNQLTSQVLLISCIYIITTSILPFGNSRIRVLLEPFLIILFIENLKKYLTVSD